MKAALFGGQVLGKGNLGILLGRLNPSWECYPGIRALSRERRLLINGILVRSDFGRSPFRVSKLMPLLFQSVLPYVPCIKKTLTMMSAFQKVIGMAYHPYEWPVQGKLPPADWAYWRKQPEIALKLCRRDPCPLPLPDGRKICRKLEEAITDCVRFYLAATRSWQIER